MVSILAGASGRGAKAKPSGSAIPYKDPIKANNGLTYRRIRNTL